MTPSTQKDRPISFMLWDNLASAQLAQIGLVIRPEELTRTDPSRINDTQTLGGAWSDNFGEGLSSLTLSGHTGWRGTAKEDGLALFQRLYETVFKQWHELRRNNADSGIDPDGIELIFNDRMDNITVVVSPGQFQLRRHKSRPLLAQYNINMTILRDASEEALIEADKITAAISNPRGRYRAASVSMSETIRQQQEWAKTVDGVLGFSLSGVAQSVLDTSVELLKSVQDNVDIASGFIDATLAPLLFTATAFQQAARNAFQVLAAPANLAIQVKRALMSIAAAFNNAYCTLVNGFGLLTQFPDFSDLFGASTCSSTGGGRPASIYARENPFVSMFPLETRPVSVTQNSTLALNTLRQADPLSLSAAAMPDQLQIMAEGIQLGNTGEIIA